METNMKCLCRNKRTFKLCKKNVKQNNNFCRYHKDNNYFIYVIFNNVFGNKCNLDMSDIFNLYKYISDNAENNNYIEDKPGYLFIELLKNIPYKLLLLLSKRYLNESKKYVKNELYNFLNDLNSKSYKICKYEKINILQNKFKYYLLNKTSEEVDIINTDDLFTCELITDIPKNRLFILKDINGSYGFDVVELDYFIKKCIDEKKEPYNPYTREKINEDTIWRISKFMEYNKIEPRELCYNWDTNIQAYTDLSIELERRGFYNSPEWLNKMSTESILKTVKYFKDFSVEIEESNRYFNNITANNVVFDFCKDGIKLLKECNEDLYILCCNLFKSLALCSNDFYENIPSWMSGINTSSLLSGVFSIFGDTSGPMPNNFLLYYYVEYM